MVIALFLQIIVMIIDRYLYKSKTFISVQDKEVQNRRDQNNNYPSREKKQQLVI
jgi:hypothetical protein